MSKETDNLIRDVSEFIEKVENSAQKNQLTCGNCFQNLDDYKEEKILFGKIKIGNFSNTKEQGDALEELVKLMFSRIDLVKSVTITTKETAIGQIDIILMVSIRKELLVSGRIILRKYKTIKSLNQK
jgi:hypothetical protein